MVYLGLSVEGESRFRSNANTGGQTLGVVKLRPSAAFASMKLGWCCVACLWGLELFTQQDKANNEQRKSLQSVSHSETDVTVNLSSFAELSVMQTMQEDQQNR